MNHILAICDAEEEYASKLAEYLNLKEDFPFQVRYFTSPERLLQFANTQLVEVVLTSEEWESSLFEKRTEWIILSLKKEGKNTEKEIHSVMKYQSCENLMKEVLQILADHPLKCSHIARGVSLKIIGLYSPVKRSLQTSFGITMGQLLAKKGRTLYINLEGFSGLNVMLKRNFQRDLSDLLYYLKNGKQGLTYIMGSMVESINGLDILPPMLCQMDLISIEAKEWIQLFYEIERYSDYEYLILDLSDSVQGLFDILRQCFIIYTMTESDGFAMAKIDQYEKILKKSRYEDVISKTNKCQLPRFTYLPKQLDRLTVSELANTVKECLKEDIYAVR